MITTRTFDHLALIVEYNCVGFSNNRVAFDPNREYIYLIQEVAFVIIALAPSGWGSTLDAGYDSEYIIPPHISYHFFKVNRQHAYVCEWYIAAIRITYYK